MTNIIYKQVVGVGKVALTEQEVTEYNQRRLAADLAAEKALKVDMVKAHREALLNQPFTFDSKVFDMTASARENLLEQFVTLADGEQIFWRLHNNSIVELTSAQFAALIESIKLFKKTSHAVSWQHFAAIEALTEQQAVYDYDYTIGWPDPTNPPIE